MDLTEKVKRAAERAHAARIEYQAASKALLSAQMDLLYEKTGLYVGCIIETPEFDRRSRKDKPAIWKVGDIDVGWRSDSFIDYLERGEVPGSLHGYKTTATGFHKTRMYIQPREGWRVLRDDPRADPRIVE